MAIEQLSPASWTNQDIILYHGTTVEAAREIVAGKIDLRFGKLYRDFGPGFYTTTIEHQARKWAKKVVQRRTTVNGRLRPATVSLVLGLEELAQLQSLSFVDGGFGAEQFWSFVHHCRNGAADHGRVSSRSSTAGSYDVVFGPVSAFWNERKWIRDADQISFHTEESLHILNTRTRRSIISS